MEEGKEVIVRKHGKIKQLTESEQEMDLTETTVTCCFGERSSNADDILYRDYISARSSVW